jgi:hypothetical protein
MEYHKTKDIIYVMQMLGHIRIQNTLKYTQFIKLEDSDTYVCKVSKDDDEISTLIEAGFEYVRESDGARYGFNSGRG